MAREVPTEAISLVGPIPTGWIPVASSWLNALRYHPESHSFDIRTKTGAVYEGYPGCSSARFREFLAAPSKGQWLARNYPPRSH